jgi:hypothetical protein
VCNAVFLVFVLCTKKKKKQNWDGAQCTELNSNCAGREPDKDNHSTLPLGP